MIKGRLHLPFSSCNMKWCPQIPFKYHTWHCPVTLLSSYSFRRFIHMATTYLMAVINSQLQRGILVMTTQNILKRLQSWVKDVARRQLWSTAGKKPMGFHFFRDVYFISICLSQYRLETKLKAFLDFFFGTKIILCPSKELFITLLWKLRGKAKINHISLTVKDNFFRDLHSWQGLKKQRFLTNRFFLNDTLYGGIT